MLKGYLYLTTSKLTGVAKMIAVKKCGNNSTSVLNSVQVNLIRSVVCMVVGVVIALVARLATWSYFAICVLSGVANALLMLSWILAAMSVSLCTVESFVMIGSVVLPLLVTPFLYDGEKVSLLQWIACALLLAAVLLFSAKKKGEKTSLLTYAWLVTCMLSAATTNITSKYYVYKVGNEYAAFFNAITFIVVFLFFLICYIVGMTNRKKTKGSLESEEVKFGIFSLERKTYFWIAIAAVTMYTFQFFNTLASGRLPSAILYPLSYGAGFLLTAVIDTFLYKEKLTPKRGVAILLATIGSVLVVL